MVGFTGVTPRQALGMLPAADTYSCLLLLLMNITNIWILLYLPWFSFSTCKTHRVIKHHSKPKVQYFQDLRYNWNKQLSLLLNVIVLLWSTPIIRPRHPSTLMWPTPTASSQIITHMAYKNTMQEGLKSKILLKWKHYDFYFCYYVDFPI